MRIYCQKCGQPSEYSGALGKPKFCSHCGTPYGVTNYRLDAAKETPPVSKANKPNPIVEAQIDYEDDIPNIPNISKLDFDIDTSFEEPRSVTIGDLAGSESMINADEPRLPDPDMSSEEFLQSFQKEAGSLRPKGSNSDG